MFGCLCACAREVFRGVRLGAGCGARPVRCVNVSMTVYFCCQALSDSAGTPPLAMFSVRGDGLTTAMTDKTGVSAFVATASVASYVATVMEVQTTGTNAGSGFNLFHVGGEWGVVERWWRWWCGWCVWWVVERALFG
jgi:hypothetical protein